jgi:biopolymer transport protein ExbD
VRADGSYSVGGREVDLPEIELMLREGAGDDPEALSVQIRGDRQTPFGKVEQLMELCPRQGVTNVAFRVLQAGE